MNDEHSDRKELSKDAYHALNLPESQREVLAVLVEHGPLTANGIADYLPHSVLRNIRSRLNEMEKKWLVEDMGKVSDPVSGKQVTLWAIRKEDGTTPTQTPARKRSKVQAKLDSLAQVNIELRFQVMELQEALRLSRERLRTFFNKHPSMLKLWHIVVSASRDGREKLNASEKEFPSPR